MTVGLFGKFFDRSSSEGEAVSVTDTATCAGCGESFDAADLDQEGLCEPCFEVSGGPSYCCGMMYEDGESTCVSCGEPL